MIPPEGWDNGSEEDGLPDEAAVDSDEVKTDAQNEADE